MARKKQPRYVIEWSPGWYYHPHRMTLPGSTINVARQYTYKEAERVIKRRQDNGDWDNAKIVEVNQNGT